MIHYLKELEERIMKSKLILFLVSFYSKFLDICAIPFDKMDKSRIKNRVESYYRENPKRDYLFLIGFISFISLILFHQFIFGKYVFIYDEYDVSRDCIDAHYPYIYHLFRSNDGLSFWSFNSGVGNNMFTNIMTFFVDPFAILGALLWDPIENGFIYMHILKLICIALIFYKLVLKLTQNRYCAILTSILFTFNGFLMLWGQHYYFVNKVLYFLLLIYAMEIFLEKKKRWLLIFALMLNFTDVYFFYQCVFLGGFYLIFRNLYFEGNLRGLFSQIMKLLPWGIISLLLSAFFVLPSVYILGSGPRVNVSKFNVDEMVFSLQSLEYYMTLFSRFFSNNLSGDGINYFGYSQNYMVAPQVYSGLITLLLIPQVFSIKDPKTKRAVIAVLLIALITLLLPFFAYLFTAFQELYYRWTFGIITLNVISLALILNSVIRGNFLNRKILHLTFFSIGFLLAVFWMYYRRHEEVWIRHDMVGLFNVDLGKHIFSTLIPISIFLILYYFLLQLFNRYKVVIGILILMVISSELIIENYPTFYKRGIVEKGHNPYNNASQKVIQKIKEQDKTPFYRIEKQLFSVGNCSLASNDAMVHDYFGLKTYNSYNPKSYYDFCLSFGLIEKNHWANLLPSLTPDVIPYDLVDILSVKYLLSKDVIEHASYQQIDKVGDILIYKNKKFKPLGFTYSSYISNSELKELPDSVKHKSVQKYIVLEDEDIPALKKYVSENSGKNDVMKMNYFSNSRIKGEINNSQKTLLFFSIPFDKGWQFTVNDKVVKYYKANSGFIALPLDKGRNRVELNYSPPFFKIGLLISITTCILCVLYLLFTKRKKVILKSV